MSTVHLNKVAHYKEGKSDKVYIASIVPTYDGDGNLVDYRVIGKYSRIYKNMTSQAKGTFSNLASAEAKRDELFFSKVKKGYVDIETVSYFGELDCTNKWLLENVEPDPEFNHDAFKDAFSGAVDIGSKIHEEVEKIIPTSAGNKDFEVLCINASGMEDSFDFEVTYIAEHHTDSDMIYVWDRNGVKLECFAERFSICEVTK